MIQAYGDRILVRIVEIEKKKSLVIIPDEKKEYQIGQVVSRGNSCWCDDIDEVNELEDGMYVWTRKYAGLLVEYDGVEYVSLDQKEILAFSLELK